MIVSSALDRPQPHAQVILVQLGAKFGPLADTLVAALERCDDRGRLKRIAQQLLAASSLDELDLPR